MAIVICLMCGKSADLQTTGYRFCDECFEAAEEDANIMGLQDALSKQHPDRLASWEREFTDEEREDDERFWN